MDFDVLADNYPPNTSRVDAHTDLNRMRSLMESQQQDWDVNYSRGMSSPLDWKLAAVDDLAFCRVQFFGGALDVIAREYEIVTAKSDD